jgi:predicted metal-binding membrane protein
VYCCAGLTAVLLVIGVMDVRAMTAVTAAITLERLAPEGQRMARVIGVILVAAGLAMIARAAAG